MPGRPRGAEIVGIGYFTREDARVLASALVRGGVPIVKFEELPSPDEIELQVPLTFFPRAHRIFRFGPVLAACFSSEMLRDLYEAQSLLKSVERTFCNTWTRTRLEHSGRDRVREFMLEAGAIREAIEDLIWSVKATGETPGDVPESLPLDHAAYEDVGEVDGVLLSVWAKT